LSYLLPIKFFIYLHGNDILCPLKNSLFRWLFKITLQRAQGVVCNSTFTRDYLNSHLQFNTPTYIINPTVRPEKFGLKIESQTQLVNLQKQVRQNYNISETAVVILSVGRLVKRKGFDRVIEQLPQLIAQGLDVHYIICGRGAMEAELKTLVEKLQLQQRVHFAGFVPDNKLAAYYIACDIFAMLTFYDSQAASIEGFGIVYAEAGYFGKPVIASRVGGVVDAVHHQENGILVDPNSSEELFVALNKLCQDEQLRQQLGTKGREFAQRKQSWSLT
jgi:glycosyltransferase involved in cell wall biosynthesis